MSQAELAQSGIARRDEASAAAQATAVRKASSAVSDLQAKAPRVAQTIRDWRLTPVLADAVKAKPDPRPLPSISDLIGH